MFLKYALPRDVAADTDAHMNIIYHNPNSSNNNSKGNTGVQSTSQPQPPSYVLHMKHFDLLCADLGLTLSTSQLSKITHTLLNSHQHQLNHYLTKYTFIQWFKTYISSKENITNIQSEGSENNKFFGFLKHSGRSVQAQIQAWLAMALHKGNPGITLITFNNLFDISPFHFHAVVSTCKKKHVF